MVRTYNRKVGYCTDERGCSVESRQHCLMTWETLRGMWGTRSPRHSLASTQSDCVQYKRIYSTAVVKGIRCSFTADATSSDLLSCTRVSLTLLKRKQTCWFSTRLKVTTSGKTIWTCSSKQTNAGTVSNKAGCLFYSAIRGKRGLSLGLKQQLQKLARQRHS